MTDTASASEIAVEPEVTSRRKALITRLSVWLLFGVMLGLLPLIARVIKGAMSKDGLSITEVLGDGELFIVSAVIAAGAMGELFAGAFKECPSLLTVLAGFWTLSCFAVLVDHVPAAAQAARTARVCSGVARSGRGLRILAAMGTRRSLMTMSS